MTCPLGSDYSGDNESVPASWHTSSLGTDECDGLIEAPVFGLLYHFCQARRLHANALYDQAYPGEGEDNWAEEAAFGEWQVVTCPAVWDATTVAGPS